MTTDTASAIRSQSRARFDARRWLVLGAPAAAVLAGLAAEFLDFRALRYPLLLIVLAGVVATAYALGGGRSGVAPFALAVAAGVASWAAAETLYVALHLARGQEFETTRFAPEWAKALWLIAAHGVFLGLPTGVAAGLVLQAVAWRRGRGR